MKALYIFFIFSYSYCFAQNHKTIIKEEYVTLKTYENDKLVKSDRTKKTFTYVYDISSKKDSISYYDISYEPIDKISPTIFVLKKEQNENNLLLLINENGTSDTLHISFFDNSKSITINKDIYFLNSLYYNQLKSTILINKNILDLIDLLDDDLGDYPYQFKDLLKITSNNKYKNSKLKILSAKIYTTRTQSDTQDIWNVNYKYNKNGVLMYLIKKSNDEEIGYEKKLLSQKGREYKYKIYSNVESRFEDNNVIAFDTDKNTYNAILSHFQFGKVKEEISQLKRFSLQNFVAE
ncbi:hypothetical protein [Epilithonimonas hungarica]|uniref:Uncharacterized protein n=1 Tax=Epilithonimonas hungarica TaxID=454006 RepID=A0A1G7VYQ3_9FLAO|nr:hypothetical protein [Epilithonimonas hungarica]MDP9958122.1 hypothetical protein [Epilithonimonas hungarica]SDG64877.1 hypothetical protein SAMN05421825_3761 [Epilithonimonas hungarica]